MVEEFDMPHLKKNLIVDEMTSLRWHEFNKWNIMLNKYIETCHGKIVL
jgi:hypothetical protein